MNDKPTPATQTDHIELSRERRKEYNCLTVLEKVWDPWWLRPDDCRPIAFPQEGHRELELLASMENPVPYIFGPTLGSGYSIFGCAFPESLQTRKVLQHFHTIARRWIADHGYDYFPWMTFEFMLAYTALWEVSVQRLPIAVEEAEEYYGSGAFFDMLVAYNFSPWGKDAYRSLITLNGSFLGGNSIFGAWEYGRANIPSRNDAYFGRLHIKMRTSTAYQATIGPMLVKLSEELLVPTQAQQ